MSRFKRILLAWLTSGLLACTASDSNDGQSQHANAKPEPLLPLHGVERSQADLLIQISSNGCTNAADISADVVDDGPLQLVTIKRLKPDYCRRMPFLLSVPLAADEIGLDANKGYRLLNPITRPPRK